MHTAAAAVNKGEKESLMYYCASCTAAAAVDERQYTRDNFSPLCTAAPRVFIPHVLLLVYCGTLLFC